jgi:peptide/nickel transport system permease protein
MDGDPGQAAAPRSWRPVGGARLIRWFLVRTLQAVATLLAALVIIFFLMRVLPGDPVPIIVGDRQVGPEEIARIRARFGLDRPLPTQFWIFLKDASRGNLGTSIQYNRPVTQLIGERLWPTLLLGGTVLLINFTVGLALGVWQAVKKGKLIDRLLSGFSLLGYAMPSFWLGLLLVWLFAVELRLFPSGHISDPLLDPGAPFLTRALDVAWHLVLPALTLSVVSIAATMRYQRNAMLEVLRLDYVRTARAKGLSEGRVIVRHAWRNALFPVLTLFGLWLPILAAGSVFVESVFSWNGLGWLAAEAIGYRDYPLLMGAAMLVSTLIVLGGLLTDVGYMILDPRVRRS